MGENKKKKLILLSMLGIALLLIAGCGTQTGQVVNEKPIKIGYLGPLTGDVSAIGLNNRAGMELAIKEINKNGGVNGRLVEVIFEDGKCNPRDAATAAQKLVNINKVPVIVGGLCSSETLAAAPIAEGRTVMISPGSSSPDVTDAGDYIFRDYPSDLFQGAYAAEFAYNELGARKAAILYCLSDWCVGLDNRFKERFEELGGSIIVEDQFEQGAKDLRTQLVKIKNANPDLIYFLAYTESSVAGFQQMKELGITETTLLLGGDTWSDPTIPQRAGNAADGALHVEAFTPENSEFKARMRAHTGNDEVTLATPQIYDATRIIVGIMRKVGTNPEDIKNALYNVKYDGVSGHIEFDENGDLRSANYAIFEFSNGESFEYKG